MDLSSSDSLVAPFDMIAWQDKEFIYVFFPKLGYGEQLFGLELNFDEKEKGDSDSPELAPHVRLLSSTNFSEWWLGSLLYSFELSISCWLL